MAINPIITSKVNSLDVPDVIKQIMHELLEIEENLKESGKKDNAAISKTLEKYADDKTVQEFCDK